MAYGCPLICTGVYGDGDLVVAGATGWVVPADAQSAANAIMEALSDPELAACYGRASHQRCVEKYSVTVIGRAMERLYLKVLGRPVDELRAEPK
jgi:glycosyltransferase involved in cell wall biosynthesis